MGASWRASGALLALALVVLCGCPSIAAAETYAQAVEATSGLAHFWPMGEPAGSSFGDAIGEAPATVGGGVTFGEPGGLIGDASTSALFDGSSGAASAGVDLSGTHELTVEFWMKWSSYAADDRLALEFTPNFNEYSGGFLVDPDATPGSDFAVALGSGASRNTVYFERPSPDAWHYYTFVMDTEASAETQITPYVDGKAVSFTKTVSGTGAGSFANSTLFWMSRDASSLLGAGDMQDLALYSDKLSLGTIQHHYEIGKGGPHASFASLPVDATAGVPVRLNASASTSPVGSITDYAWDFDGGKGYGTDGGSSSTVSHTFSSPGTYTVDLRVTDGTSATATVSHTITVGAALGEYEQEVEDTAGIAHFWPMGEVTGSSFADIVEGSDAEVLGGVTLGEPGATTESTTSALFDGSSGAARANVDLSGTKKLTVEFWSKWSAFAEDDHLAMELTPNFNENAGGFLIDPDASGTGRFGLGLGLNETRNNAFFERPSAEHWHYYAFTLDTTAAGATEIKPYVDGHLVSYTKGAEGTGAGAFAKSVLYWMSRDAGSLFGEGAMQDVALYEDVLSKTTILHHYEIGAGLPTEPTATFGSLPVSATAGVPVTLDASASSSPAGPLTDYAWDFDGGKGYGTDTGATATETHTFSTPGTYTVDLRVEDENGATDTVSHTIAVGSALPAYDQAVEKTFAIGHFWPMGETSGSTFADVFRGDDATTAGGVTLGESGGLLANPAAKSAAFDGSSGAASAAVNLSGTHKLTVEFWMKWGSYAPDDRLALEFTPNFNENAGGLLVDPDATPGSDFAVSIGQGGSRNSVFFERPSAGAWHYYAFVIDTEAAAETEIVPYVDGKAVSYTKAESVGTGAGKFANSTLYWMSRDASALFGHGDMQDLALYAGTLSSSTIEQHYELGAATLTNTVAPSIAGNAQDGQTLTASPGTWTGVEPIAYAYQWESCNAAGGECQDLEGANEPNYALSPADLEAKLRVRVTASSVTGSAQVISAASAVVEPGPPSELEQPSISGAPNVGEALHGNPGVWAGADTEESYQWERCNATAEECMEISGAVEPEYALGEADIGMTLRLRVGASNELGSLTALSPPTSAIGAPSLLENTLAPTVAGALKNGQTLTAEPGSWLAEGMISYGYQWERCDRYGSGCEAITGATGSTFALGSGDVGHALRVRVSASETGGTLSAASVATQPVTVATAPEIEVPPVVSGTGLVGYALTAGSGAWSGEEPLSYGYQWVRCAEDGSGCSAISGATASSYTLAESDVASTVEVIVTATDPSSHSTEAVSLPIAVSAATLVHVAAPSISGEYKLGRPLKTDQGIWTGSGAIGYSFQWERCDEAGGSCSPLTGATGSSYTPVSGDASHTLKVVVTGTGTAGTETTSSAATPVIGSEPTEPANIEEPSIEGYPTAGDTLTAQHGLWTGSEPISYKYEWQTCTAEGEEECTEIEGATSETFVLPESAIGSTVRVVVRAINTAGFERATSPQTDVIQAPTSPEDTESPTIYGSLKAGVQSFAGNGTWTGSQPLRYYYQWERCNAGGESCSGIEGATKTSYTPESGDVGSTLRIRVTVSNSLGSASAVSTVVPVASATEASVTQALEAAEATDPSIVAPSTATTLEEQTVEPAIGDSGEVVSSTNGLTSSTISKETPGEFAVNAVNEPLSFMPLDASVDATATPTIVNGTAAVFAGTAHATDTFVRPNPLGTTTILQLRSTEAPTSFTWEVGIGSDQELEELPDGSVAVVELSSSTYLESELPTEALETPESETSEEPTGEGATEEAAETELESTLEEEGVLEPLPAAPTASTPEVTPKSGELHPQETEAEYASANNAMSVAQEHTAGSTVMVIRAPTVLDALGATVSSALKIEGNTVTMTVSPGEGTTYPVTAAVAVNAPTDKASATKASGAQFGFSDLNAKPFGRKEGPSEESTKFVSNLDSHLTSGPLKVKRARLVLSYNTSPTNERLHEWLKAVTAAGLTPFITLGRCESVPANYKSTIYVPCHTSKVPSRTLYYADAKRLMKALIKGTGEELPVRLWGAWNEPDSKRTSLHADPKGAINAAYLWGEAQRATEDAGCKHHCTVVAGEFQEYGKDYKYIRDYQESILQGERRHSFPVKVKPLFWGVHDYKDLVNVRGVNKAGKEILGNYINSEAKGFLRQIRSRQRSDTHMWLTEQGVMLQNGSSETHLFKHTELQRLSAADFLRLGKPSEHVEWAYYYLYEGPTEERIEKKQNEFDSALLHGEGVTEPQEPREAYCVLALGNNEGCPAKTITKTAVAGTTTANAGTVLFDVYPEGLPTKYLVEYGTTAAYGNTTASADVLNDAGGQSETASLGELSPCTTYHYQAEAENSANEGTPSLGGDRTFRTGGCGPIAAGLDHTCAVRTGAVYCWGDDRQGQLGNGVSEGHSTTPVAVGELADAASVTTGGEHTCAVLTSGGMDCWGLGALGTEATEHSATPVEVTEMSSALGASNYTESGAQATCAVLSGGEVDCWGAFGYGDMFENTPIGGSDTPEAIGGVSGATAVTAGVGFACALISDGDVDCWGDNEGGRLGNGSHKDSSTAVKVSGISNATAIAGDAATTCAVLANGSVDCWGYNGHGQLGIGTTGEPHSTPVAVSEIGDATAVAVGEQFTCALRSEGTIDCWGANEDGQLGDGTIEDSTKPVAVLGISTAVAVSAGFDYACALLEGDEVVCWGANKFGQLGDGTTEDRTIPVFVSGLP